MVVIIESWRLSGWKDHQYGCHQLNAGELTDLKLFIHLILTDYILILKSVQFSSVQ